MTGKDLAEEDEEFMKYLVANGWEGMAGENEDKHVLRKGDIVGGSYLEHTTSEGVVKGDAV
jgi:hypothetical protein